MALLRVKFPTATRTSVNVNIPSRQNSLERRKKVIWAIGGGKGGIGKTLLASNMGIYLSWLNQRVVLVDLDLGGANLHTLLGVDPPNATLSDLMLGQTDDIQRVVQSTDTPNLKIISGAQDPLDIANLRHIQRGRLVRKFEELDCDFVILDLGAGSSSNTLEFFLLADEKIVLVTPEPTSIENAYRFIKATFFRMLRSHATLPSVQQIIEHAIESKNSRTALTPRALLNEILNTNPTEGKLLEQKIASFRLRLIVNQTRVKAEDDIGKSIELVCQRYFGIRVEYLGSLAYDNVVWQSVRQRKPFMQYAPNSAIVTQMENILRSLLAQPHEEPLG